jgi:hypothetical protein
MPFLLSSGSKTPSLTLPSVNIKLRLTSKIYIFYIQMAKLSCSLLMKYSHEIPAERQITKERPPGQLGDLYV